MENSSEELFKFLNDSGKVAMLRKHMFSFLLSVEELRTDVDTPEGHDCAEGQRLIQNLEFRLNQLALYEQKADKMFGEMEKEQRQTLYREAPEVLKLFGWQDKINEAGDIVKKI